MSHRQRVLNMLAAKPTRLSHVSKIKTSKTALSSKQQSRAIQLELVDILDDQIYFNSQVTERLESTKSNLEGVYQDYENAVSKMYEMRDSINDDIKYLYNNIEEVQELLMSVKQSAEELGIDATMVPGYTTGQSIVQDATDTTDYYERVVNAIDNIPSSPGGLNL
jgi:DNA repair ATPase RecN